jgi:hypothetical protein
MSMEWQMHQSLQFWKEKVEWLFKKDLPLTVHNMRLEELEFILHPFLWDYWDGKRYLRILSLHPWLCVTKKHLLKLLVMYYLYQKVLLLSNFLRQLWLCMEVNKYLYPYIFAKFLLQWNQDCLQVLVILFHLFN